MSEPEECKVKEVSGSERVGGWLCRILQIIIRTVIFTLRKTGTVECFKRGMTGSDLGFIRAVLATGGEYCRRAEGSAISQPCDLGQPT